MGKFLKIVLILVGVVVLVVGGAAAYIAFAVDPNDYREEISAQVKSQTGRDLTLAGDIGLSLFPWLGLTLNDARLSNAPGFGEAPFAEVGEVEVRLKLMPLLSKHLEMSKTRLIGLKVNLARAADGTTNWDDLAGGGTRPSGAPAQSGGDGQALAGLAIGGIEIRDAAFTWDDRQAGQNYALQNVTLTTGAINPGKPVDLQLGFDVSSAQPAMKGRIELSGNVSADPAAQRFSVAGADLKANLAGEGLPGGKLDATLSADLTADLGKEVATVKGLRLAAFGVDVTGDVNASKIQSAPQASGKLTVAEFALADLVAQLGIALPEGVQADKLGNVRLETEFSATRDSADISRLLLAIAGGQVNASAKVRNFASPAVTGKLEVSGINPRTLLAASGSAVETADPQVLTRADLTTGFGASPNHVELNGLKIKLDDTAVDGNLTLRDFAKPAIRFGFDVDAIDADRYLPPPSDTPQPATPGTAAGGAAQLPVEQLRALDIDGELKVGKLKAYNLRSQNIVLRLTAKGGQLRVNPARADMYDGSYSGNIGLDVRGEQPKLSLDESLQGVQAGPLLKDLTGQERVLGKAQASARLTAAGADPQAMQQTLNGKLAFAFTDGAVKGVNLAKLIRDAQGALSGKPPTGGGSAEEQTDFTELTGTATVTNGLVDNRDLSMKSPVFRIAGEGTADLPKQKVDYLVKASVVGALTGQGGEDLSKLKGVTIPVRIKGSLSDPGFSVDLASLATEQVKEKAAAEVEKQLQKQLGGGTGEAGGGGATGDALKKGLKGLFGN